MTGTIDLVIRRAMDSDAATLAEFAARTFTETFGPDNRAEDMAMFLESSFRVGAQSAGAGILRQV